MIEFSDFGATQQEDGEYEQRGDMQGERARVVLHNFERESKYESSQYK